MALTINFTPDYTKGAVTSVTGSAASDAVAMPSQSGSTTAANDTVTGVAATAAFSISDVVRVTGAVQKFLHVIQSITANTSLRLVSNLRTTTTEAVTVTKLANIPLYFDMPMYAKSVEWSDETNGVTWSWSEGMKQGAAYKRVWATGVQTLENGVGLMLFQNQLSVGPDVAPVSSTFRFKISA